MWPATGLGKSQCGNHIVALALTFFLIRGDAGGTPGADLLDAVKRKQGPPTIQGGVAIDTTFEVFFLVKMGIATTGTEARRAHRQFRRYGDVLFIANAKNGLFNPVRAAFMVDNRLGAKL